jgi:hypothetical protein
VISHLTDGVVDSFDRPYDDYEEEILIPEGVNSSSTRMALADSF